MTTILDILKNLKIKNYTTYGKDIAKVDETFFGKKQGKLVLVTAISPTKSGNGKTTVSIGLADALNKIKKTSAILSLREPSMGPVFGLKGGATGGGKCLLVPSSDINLHFTGDMHAITAANNLICACIDNSIYQGNPLDIDINKILFNRCLDCNDRALRSIEVGDKNNKRKENFIITPASEIMAILCLSSDFEDFRKRVSKIIVALSTKGKPIYVKDLEITDAVCSLMINAINPNLVRSLADTPAFVHGGPFANIAHGASSIIATKKALSYADYAITEAGFGADLGAEKFFNVVCPKLGKYPDAVVLIATVNALKYNGNGVLEAGLCNLKRHIENLKVKFNANLVVAVNKFTGDSKAELDFVINYCKRLGVDAAICDAYNNGASGAMDLANMVIKAASKTNNARSLYSSDLKIEKKIEKIAKEVYGAGSVSLSDNAKEKLKQINKLKLNSLPVIMAKTQYSFTADEKVLGAPTGFILEINDLQIKSGAGFIVAVCGKQLLMPALPKQPNACKVKLDRKKIVALD